MFTALNIRRVKYVDRATSTLTVVTGPGMRARRAINFTASCGPGHVLRSLLREFLEEDFLNRVCRHRLTRSQFCFLKLITTNSDLQVGELARCLGVSPAASSKNLDRLESLGLVYREASDQDRRAILLKASATG